MPVERNKNEEGFTMIVTVLGLALMATLVLVALTAVNGDSHLTLRDLQQKQAYEAAKAGIDDYAYHLHANNSYWTQCASMASPGAVNLEGSTQNRLTVPGVTTAEYAIELLPSTTQSTYKQCSTTHATESMLQSQDPLKGTFRIRSNGYAGPAHAKIIATFKPASFLDYVYFTQLETSDPATYPTAMIPAANTQCSKTIRGGRYSAEIESGKGYCDVIVFGGEDHINGPMHTNDAFVVCSSPYLGREPADPVEVSSPPKGWYSASELSKGSCSGNNNNFLGTFTANSPVLTPPSTNEELHDIAEPQFRYKGQYRMCLTNKTMRVMRLTAINTCKEKESAENELKNLAYSGPLPSNGVVYFESWECNGSFSPFNVTYKIAVPQSECGEVYVEGTYTGQLTIAAENNIVITGNLCLESCEAKLPFKGTGVLGLVANNFIRLFHPIKNFKVNSKGEDECENASGTIEHFIVDAAVLAIKHSFIVDNYDCGARLQKLTVNGAIAQKYRGAVGKTGTPGRGYTKDYNYDNRLKYIEPPSFIAPEKTAWVIGRETLE